MPARIAVLALRRYEVSPQNKHDAMQRLPLRPDLGTDNGFPDGSTDGVRTPSFHSS